MEEVWQQNDPPKRSVKSEDVVVCQWMTAHHGEVSKPVIPDWNGGLFVTDGSIIEK